eukprot:TRINITY_DN194_c0_g1_i1.p1 TRINITY_DN194_c0_g1~~TRINITY_DN194_c0_g1_i1.p1  ORF type:complete len:133 (+),score=56.77 TRINITY_DN194_c0_g1_i1:62-460(+)
MTAAVDTVRAELQEMVKPGRQTEKEDLALKCQEITKARYALYAAETKVYPEVYPPPAAGDGSDLFDAADEGGEGAVTYKEFSKYIGRNQHLNVRLGEGWPSFVAQFSIEDLRDCPKAEFMRIWQEAAALRKD